MILPNQRLFDTNERSAGPSGTPEWEPDIVAFCCSYCASSAAALAGSKRLEYPACVRIIQTPCTGKIEMEHILESFEKGIDGVLVVGCLEGGCHFVEGNLRARKRTERVRSLLDEIGIRSERLRMVNLSDSMAAGFVQSMQEIVEAVKGLGPNPLKASERRQESAGKL